MELHYNVGSLFAFYASFTAFLSLAKQFYHQFIPKQIRDYIDDKIKVWFSKKTILDPKIFTLVIRQTFEEHSYTHINSVYSACEVYLTDKLTASSARLEGCRNDKQEGDLVSYHLVQGEEYVEYVELDNENNTKSVKLQWKFSCRNDKDEEIKGGRYKLFELSFDPQYKDLILGKFIPSVVVKNYNKFMEAKKEIFLYTYNGIMSSSRQWNKVSFKHPFTFDALALDPELKKSIVEDLDRFVRRREFYKKIGRAWKRGYLLYGPPGTGKSSLIAAIANYLKFSVYDLQLASIEKDSTLRNLMMSISNKSILVIEDIDCASGLSRKVALSRNNVARPRNVACLGDGGDYGYSSDDSDYGSENCDVYGSIGYEYYDEDEDNYGDDKANNNGRTEAAADSQNKIELTLSGLLNFIDGLWSSCGDERIIILTTNYKERLDPALLRPGRMDLHIHMSYLRMPAFRTLAYNYLGLSEHPLFKEIEVLLERTDVSPAEAAEELIRSEDPDIALDGLVKLLKKKKRFVKVETKGKEDGVDSECIAEKQKSGSESTSHTEITEEC